MGVNWTPAQNNAREANGSVLVSAAAGSGKTAVLVQRVIDRLTNTENPVPANRLLVVTYTRAAATEMLDRIKNKLDELIEKDPNNYHFRRQRILLAQASISTIHSFCSNLIKDNFFSLGISHDIRVGDDIETMMLSNEALTNVIEDLYKNPTEEFNKFSMCFNSFKNDKRMEKAILKTYEFLNSHPFPEKWTNELLKSYNDYTEFSSSIWGKEIINNINNLLNSVKTVHLNILGELETIYSDLNNYGFSKYLNINNIELNDKKFNSMVENINKIIILFKSDIVFLEEIEKRINQNIFNSVSLMDEYDYGRLSFTDAFKSAYNTERLKITRDYFKTSVSKIKDLCCITEKECNEDILEMKIIISELFKIVDLYNKEFLRLKIKSNIYEFSDLEHFAIKLLIKETDNGYEFTELAKSVSKKFDEVMVDEYQDANEVQNLIFKAVSGNEKNLFTVGDVKQSIYRFRQAMPEIFINKSNSFPLYNNKKQKQSKIILDNNFRSRKEITESINFIFENIMSEACGEINYNEEQKLKAAAVYPKTTEKAVNYKIISNKTKQNTEEIEAMYIAEYINDQIKNKYITKNNELVHPTFSDFAIIMRSPGTRCLKYVRILNEHGIPAVTDKESGFFENREIQLLVSLLNVIDNPLQDIHLATVLTSPIFNFSFDELAKIRFDNKEESLYISLKKYSEKDKKSKEFLDKIKELRFLSVSYSVDEFINIIYDKLDIKAIIAAMSNGEYRINNLLLLYEYSIDYQKSGNKSLSGFVRYINKSIEMEKDLDSAKNNMDSSLNAVRIMSIHSSKGLEFPICILADTGRKFNTDTRENIIISPELGVGFTRKTEDGLFKFDTVVKQAVSISAKRREKSEEIRVLYVALTRAREKLLILNTITNENKYFQNLSFKISSNKKISPYNLIETNSFGEIITICALLHRDGGLLREKALMDGDFYIDRTYPDWDISFSLYESENITDDSKVLEEEIILSDDNILNTLKERFNFNYGYNNLIDMPIKVSVSEISKETEENFDFISRPNFMKKEGLTAAEKGTAVHKFLEMCNFSVAAENLDSEIKRLYDNFLLSKEEIDVLNRESMVKFFDSDIIKRLIKSDFYQKEFQFSVLINGKEFDKNYKGIENIVLQGAVDCFFIEDKEIVVLDYKTDVVNDENVFIQRYKNQVTYYKKALEEIYKQKVKEVYIYSIHLNKTIKVL